MTAETFKPEDIRGAIYQAHVKTELGGDDVVYVEAMNEHEAVSAAYDVNNTVVEVIDVYRVDDPKPVAPKTIQRLEALGDQRTERQTALMNQLMEDKAAAARTDALDRQWREASDGADQTAQEWLDAPTTASPATGRSGGSYFDEAPDPNFSWGPDGEPRNWDETSRSWVVDPNWDGVGIDDDLAETSHAVARAREAVAELDSARENDAERTARNLEALKQWAAKQGPADVTPAERTARNLEALKQWAAKQGPADERVKVGGSNLTTAAAVADAHAACEDAVSALQEKARIRTSPGRAAGFDPYETELVAKHPKVPFVRER